MTNMHLGHRDPDGIEVCPVSIDHKLDFDDLRDGVRAVEILNETEGAENWFLLIGELLCHGMCAGCGSQPPGSHHWLTGWQDRGVITDGDDEVIEDGDGAPLVEIRCAHCSTWRTALPNDFQEDEKE